MIITYKNPKDLSDTIDVYFDIPKNDFTDRWTEELKFLLRIIFLPCIIPILPRPNKAISII